MCLYMLLYVWVDQKVCTDHRSLSHSKRSRVMLKVLRTCLFINEQERCFSDTLIIR